LVEVIPVPYVVKGADAAAPQSLLCSAQTQHEAEMENDPMN
jgi:hypothetical protein